MPNRMPTKFVWHGTIHTLLPSPPDYSIVRVDCSVVKGILNFVLGAHYLGEGTDRRASKRTSIVVEGFLTRPSVERTAAGKQRMFWARLPHFVVRDDTLYVQLFVDNLNANARRLGDTPMTLDIWQVAVAAVAQSLWWYEYRVYEFSLWMR